MTVQTSETANQTQKHPAVRVHARDRPRGAVPEPAVHDRARRLVAARIQGAARRAVPATRPSPHSRAGGAGQAGDVAFWDNRCMQHMVMADVEGHRRAMHRTTVAGEAPIAPSATLTMTHAETTLAERPRPGRARPHGVREPARIRRDARDVQASALRADRDRHRLRRRRRGHGVLHVVPHGVPRPAQRDPLDPPGRRRGDRRVRPPRHALRPVPRHPADRQGVPLPHGAFFIFEAGTDRIEVERVYFDSGTILAQLGITL